MHLSQELDHCGRPSTCHNYSKNREFTKAHLGCEPGSTKHNISPPSLPFSGYENYSQINLKHRIHLLLPAFSSSQSMAAFSKILGNQVQRQLRYIQAPDMGNTAQRTMTPVPLHTRNLNKAISKCQFKTQVIPTSK